MKKLSRLLLIMIICFSITITSTAPVSANIKETNHSLTAEQKANEKLNKAISKLTKYVVRNEDGTFRVDAPKGITDKIDSEIYDQIIEGMEGINVFVLDGKLRTTRELKVFDPNDTELSIQGNVNKVVYRWYGLDIYMDSTKANQLANALWLGVGGTTVATGVLMMIPGVNGAVLGGGVVVGGLLTIGAGAVGYANSSGDGIIIKCILTVDRYGTVKYVPYWVYSQ